jgi:penicillin-binding protein 2B
MKALTYAAEIDSGVYRGSDTFNSATFIVGLDKNGNAIRSSNSSNVIGSIRNANNRDWGLISYDLGFAYSSNVGIASLLTKYLDDDVFMEYLVRFGFKNKVNLDGMNETIGSINYTWPLDKLTVGYGQGISLNMAQLLQAYTAIFNEGKLVKPYVLDEIVNAKTKEVIQKTDVQVIGQAIQAETATKVQALMYDVVYGERGTGQYYKVDEVSILAKTGTAQMIIDGAYSKDQYIYSVVIGLPADKPEVMVYYAFKAPVNNMAHVDTNPIKQLLRQIALVNDYREAVGAQLSEDKKSTLTTIPFKNYINHSLEYVHQDLSSMQDKIIILGTGDRVIDQYPKDVEHIMSTQNIYLLTSYEGIVLPNLIGMSKKDIQAFVNLCGMEAIYVGDGNVVSMNIEAGTLIDSTMTLEVVFQ